MAGAYPTTPVPNNVILRSVSPTLTSQSHSLKVQRRSRGAHRWSFELTYPTLTREGLAPLQAFAIGQQGQAGTFTFVCPGRVFPLGVATGTPLVDGSDQTGRTVNTKGWTASQAGIMKAGDFVLFDGHTKVYMIREDADSDSGGLAALEIEPALRVSPGNDVSVVVSNVPFTVAFVTDMQEISFDPGDLNTFEVQLVEAL